MMESSPKLEMLWTRKLQRKIYYSGYLYTQNVLMPAHRLLWTCHLKRTVGINCPATVVTDVDVTQVTSGNLYHNHPSDLADDVMSKLRCEMEKMERDLSDQAQSGVRNGNRSDVAMLDQTGVSSCFTSRSATTSFTLSDSGYNSSSPPSLTPSPPLASPVTATAQDSTHRLLSTSPHSTVRHAATNTDLDNGSTHAEAERNSAGNVHEYHRSAGRAASNNEKRNKKKKMKDKNKRTQGKKHLAVMETSINRGSQEKNFPTSVVNRNSDSNGGRIDDNYNSGRIDGNYNSGRIDDNYNGGRIRIDDNYNGGRIDDNYNGGRIDDNYNGGRIDDNYNGGRINDNCNESGGSQTCEAVAASENSPEMQDFTDLDLMKALDWVDIEFPESVQDEQHHPLCHSCWMQTQKANAILCGLCTKWFHFSCAGLTHDAFVMLMSHQNAVWLCNDCHYTVTVGTQPPDTDAAQKPIFEEANFSEFLESLLC